MECPLSFSDRNCQLFPQDVNRTVVGHLEVVYTGHDAWQVVIRRKWRLARLADHRKHWSERFKACRFVSSVQPERHRNTMTYLQWEA